MTPFILIFWLYTGTGSGDNIALTHIGFNSLSACEHALTGMREQNEFNHILGRDLSLRGTCVERGEM